MSSALKSVIQWLDKELHTAEFEDYAGARNGLQIENTRGKVTCVACAVDASERVLKRASEAGAELLLVHHGLFWGEFLPLSGVSFRKVEHCLKHGLAVYSSHLPLDAHEKYGNNALLIRALGFKKATPFFEAKGKLIGRLAKLNLTQKDLLQRVQKVVNPQARLISVNNRPVKTLGVVSGSAGDLRQAVSAGVDTLITGELRHADFVFAHEHGLNLIQAGHYATEVFGVQALGQAISKKFKLPCVWIDDPSGI